MAAPATCTLSGTLYGPTGAVVAGALVRARVVGTPPVEAGGGHASGDPVVAYTGTDGAWSIALPQGLTVWIEIPAAGIDHSFTVPSSSTATLDGLSLYQRTV
jgi:hypothetical protein